MTISSVASEERRTLTDRVARWALDTNGELYGDERERLHWYEGIVVAATLQWIAVPWAAAVLVWLLGRPAVLPLVVVVVVTYLPMMFLTSYMRSRRVDTVVRTWSRKAVLSAALYSVPYVLFMIGCFAAYADADSSVATGATIGALIGSALAGAWIAWSTRRRQHRETVTAPDVD